MQQDRLAFQVVFLHKLPIYPEDKVHKDKIENVVFKWMGIYFGVGLFIGIILTAKDTSYLFGWIAGSVIAFSTYFLSILLLKIFFKISKSKTIGFWLGWARSMIILLWVALLLVLFIWIDKAWHNEGLLAKGFDLIKSPIDFMTLLGGVGSIVVSTLLVQNPSLRKGV